MKQFLKQWSWWRGIRLMIGLALIVQGIMSREYPFAILGVFFSLSALFNRGCGCSSKNTCEVSKPLRSSKPLTEEPSFEELH